MCIQREVIRGVMGLLTLDNLFVMKCKRYCIGVFTYKTVS